MDSPLEAEEIVRKSMKIAGDICVYTNHNIVVEKLEPKPADSEVSASQSPPPEVSGQAQL